MSACTDLHGRRKISKLPPARPAGQKGNIRTSRRHRRQPGYHGAAVLATRVGTGRATGAGHGTAVRAGVLSGGGAVAIGDGMPVVARRPFPGEFSAVLVGPGLAARDAGQKLIVKASAKLWRDCSLPMVGAMRWIGYAMEYDHPKRAIRVITPHPGEAARFQNNDGAGAGKSPAWPCGRFPKIRQLLGGAFKGHSTLIGRSEGEFCQLSVIHICAHGGSGDVLAGFIAGLLAQTGLRADVGRTLRYAVWQHGATADVAGHATELDEVEEIGDHHRESANFCARARISLSLNFC